MLTPLPPTTNAAKRGEPTLYPLWIRLRAGDSSARGNLVACFAPLVKYVIGRTRYHKPDGVDDDDLRALGMVGLLQAVDRFDPDSGVKFQTYAFQRIHGAIVDGLRQMSPVRRAAAKWAREAEQATGDLAQELGRTPSRGEVADALGLSRAAFAELSRETDFVLLSLDGVPPGEADEASSLADGLYDRSEVSALERLVDHDLISELAEAIQQALCDRERLVLNLYYHQELTFKEIGLVMEVTQSRASQLHVGAVKKLREHLVTRREAPVPAAA